MANQLTSSAVTKFTTLLYYCVASEQSNSAVDFAVKITSKSFMVNMELWHGAVARNQVNLNAEELTKNNNGPLLSSSFSYKSSFSLLLQQHKAEDDSDVAIDTESIFKHS